MKIYDEFNCLVPTSTLAALTNIALNTWRINTFDDKSRACYCRFCGTDQKLTEPPAHAVHCPVLLAADVTKELETVYPLKP